MRQNEKSENKLGLTLSITRGRMLVYHATIIEMGNPDYIRFLYNDGMRRVAVQCCEKIDKEGFRVPKVSPGECFKFEISCSPFLSVIYKKCQWNVEQAYNVLGVAYPEYRLVEFKLDNARQIEPEQFMDPENYDKK